MVQNEPSVEMVYFVLHRLGSKALKIGFPGHIVFVFIMVAHPLGPFYIYEFSGNAEAPFLERRHAAF